MYSKVHGAQQHGNTDAQGREALSSPPADGQFLKRKVEMLEDYVTWKHHQVHKEITELQWLSISLEGQLYLLQIEEKNPYQNNPY